MKWRLLGYVLSPKRVLSCQNWPYAIALPHSLPMSRLVLSTAVSAWLVVLIGGLLNASGASAQTPHPQTIQAVQTLRIVGGLAGLNQYTRHEEPFWSRELSRLSAGKFDAAIVPFERAGVPGEDMLRLIQLGVVPFGTALFSSLSVRYPEYSAPDLAGLNPDMASLKKNVAAFRPYLEKMLRERHGMEALAFYVYPAQVLFCKKPLAGLADLAGRRIRVSSATQSDFVSALGALPVLTRSARIMSHMATGNIECAITGAMAGNTSGLFEMTTHVHALVVTWGLSVFGANLDAWSALQPELKALLSRELPKLEAAIWRESEQETAAGLACNTGARNCGKSRRGRMVEVPISVQDEQRRQQIFSSTVLARWLQRCKAPCAEIWNQTIGPRQGIMAPLAP